MKASNTPTIRELALAALARQRRDGETPRDDGETRRVSPSHGSDTT
jgi:hypothetical protein